MILLLGCSLERALEADAPVPIDLREIATTVAISGPGGELVSCTCIGPVSCAVVAPHRIGFYPSDVGPGLCLVTTTSAYGLLPTRR